MKKRHLFFIPILISSVILLGSFTETTSINENTTVVETTSQEIYEDSNSNGLPDEWEDYWDENITKSFTLGTVVTLSINVLYVLISGIAIFIRSKKFSTGSNNFSKEANKLIDKANTLIEEQASKMEEQTKVIEEQAKKISQYDIDLKNILSENKRLITRLNSVNNMLDTFTSSIEKIDNIASNQEKIANNLPSMIKSGESKGIKR